MAAVRYKGKIYNSIKEFCDENDLSSGYISKCIRDKGYGYTSSVTNITYKFDYSDEIVEVTSNE